MSLSCEKPLKLKSRAERCQACNKLATINDWINVKDKLPQADGRYLVVEDHAYKWVGISSMRNGKFDMPVTHWMLLPEWPSHD